MTAPTRQARPVRPAARGGRRRREYLLVPAALYALHTVAALLAWVVVGDTWWTQPVNLTTFWWALPGVALAPLALLAGRRRSAVLLAVPAAVWIWSYGTAFVPSAGPGPVDLRVASFNIYVNSPDADHVMRLVDANDPDVLILQEVFADRRAEIERRLGERYPHVEAFESPGVGAVMVLSRFPVADVVPVGDTSGRSRQTGVVRLDVDGRRVQVVPLHLISPCPTCGTSLLERLELEGDVRRAEIGAVLDALEPDVPTVLAGDLNSNERSGPYRRLVAAGFGDPQRAAGEGPGFTWPNDGRFGPWLRIDWVMTRGLRPVDAFVDRGGPSDHRPVVVDLAIP